MKVKMKFTATDLVRNASKVFNEVQRAGWVYIANRGRPDMVLVTQAELDEMLKQKYEYGYEHGQKNTRR